MANPRSGRLVFEPLDNGLDYLTSVVEHLAGSPSDRDLKYAILHLAAAVEVLVKARLSIEHWSLVFSDVDKASPDCLRTGDFQSVPAMVAIDRLEKIVGLRIDDRHVTAVKAVIDKRNRLQHHGLTDMPVAVKAVAAGALDFLLTFLDRELRSHPVASRQVHASLDGIREQLNDISKLVDTRMRNLGTHLDRCVTIVACPRCLQMALEPGEECHCHYCTAVSKPEEAAEEYVANILGESLYSAAKGRTEWSLHECPSCDREALVAGAAFRHEPSDVLDAPLYWCCFAEGEGWPINKFSECFRCGALTTLDSDGYSVCSNCESHYLSVD